MFESNSIEEINATLGVVKIETIIINAGNGNIYGENPVGNATVINAKINDKIATINN